MKLKVLFAAAVFCASGAGMTGPSTRAGLVAIAPSASAGHSRSASEGWPAVSTGRGTGSTSSIAGASAARARRRIQRPATTARTPAVTIDAAGTSGLPSAQSSAPSNLATACVGDAAFGYVNAFRDHVNVGFFFGALLNDPARLLEGTRKRGRHVKLRPGRAVDATALARLVDAAYVDIRARLRK